MSACVVVVHDEPEFADPLAAMLRLSGQNVSVLADPLEALDALDAAQPIDVLVTRVRFAPQTPNGISLALMARARRPDIQVLFVALPEFAEYAVGVGMFMAHPVSIPDVVEAVGNLLT
jgi:DNA-binding NtrC family response regulator